MRWCANIVVGSMVVASITFADDAWQPAKGPLATRWTAEVSPQSTLAEYPRPQMVRSQWKNLNGLWDYAVRPKDESRPEKFDGKILVPFPIESALSGVMAKVGDANRLWYRTSFEWPAAWKNQRALLHLGAVDWDATVLVNGKQVGQHRGGYTPLDLDITEQLNPTGPQELVVSVWDPTDAGAQPRGKQVARPNGIWYTAVTGIWQTVWIEPVPQVSIDNLLIVPDLDTGMLNITAKLRGKADDATIRVVALDGQKPIGQATGAAGQAIRLPVIDAKPWSPDSPQLYDLKVSVQSGSEAVDEVDLLLRHAKNRACAPTKKACCG